MLSESNWSRAEVRQQLIVDANIQFGHVAALVFDESAFAKKVPARAEVQTVTDWARA